MGSNTAWSRGLETLAQSNIALPDGLYVLPRVDVQPSRKARTKQWHWWLRLLGLVRARRVGVVRS